MRSKTISVSLTGILDSLFSNLTLVTPVTLLRLLSNPPPETVR